MQQIPTAVGSILGFVGDQLLSATAGTLANYAISNAITFLGLGGNDPDPATQILNQLQAIQANQNKLDSDLEALSLKLDDTRLQIEGFNAMNQINTWLQHVTDLSPNTPSSYKDRLCDSIVNDAEFHLNALNSVLLGLNGQDGQYVIQLKQLVNTSDYWYADGHTIGSANQAIEDFFSAMMNLQYTGIWLLSMAATYRGKQDVVTPQINRVAQHILDQKTLLLYAIPDYWRWFSQAEDNSIQGHPRTAFPMRLRIDAVSGGLVGRLGFQPHPEYKYRLGVNVPPAIFTFQVTDDLRSGYAIKVDGFPLYIIEGLPTYNLEVEYPGDFDNISRVPTYPNFIIVPSKDLFAKGSLRDTSFLFGAKIPRLGSWRYTHESFTAEPNILAGDRFRLRLVNNCEKRRPKGASTAAVAKRIMLAGNWDGTGTDFAFRVGNGIYFRNNSSVAFGDGNPEDEYMVGDWNGSGRDDIAVRRGNRIIFRNQSNSKPGAPGPMGPDGIDHIDFGDGNAADEYLVGDWNGSGRDDFAVRYGNRIFFQKPVELTPGSARANGSRRHRSH